MDSQQRSELEQIGRHDADVWMRYHVGRNLTRRLACPDQRSEWKRELDAFGGMSRWLQSEFPDIAEASELLSRLNIPLDEGHAWSLGFERRAVEIARQRTGW